MSPTRWSRTRWECLPGVVHGPEFIDAERPHLHRSGSCVHPDPPSCPRNPPFMPMDPPFNPILRETLRDIQREIYR